MKTNTQTLAAALRQLANDIESPDGVANAAIAEAAERLEELQENLEILRSALTHAQHTIGFLSHHLRGKLADDALMNFAEQADAFKVILKVTK
jgi:signal transduction histidine kinase